MAGLKVFCTIKTTDHTYHICTSYFFSNWFIDLLVAISNATSAMEAERSPKVKPLGFCLAMSSWAENKQMF